MSLFLDNNENLNNHEIIINAYINDKAKLTRKEFLERLRHVKFIRTNRNSSFVKFYLCTFDDYNNLKKFHDIVNKGRFDFKDENVFAIAIQPKLYNWFKTTDYSTIEKQIVCWLTGLYFFEPEKRHIMKKQIYPPLFDEILKLVDKHYYGYELVDFQKLTETYFEEENDKSGNEFVSEVKRGNEKYLSVCKTIYNGEPPEFLISPFSYKYIDGWGLTRPNVSDNFSFDVILSYFKESDWERVFVKNISTDDLHRVESRNDIWEKWKHTFGTFDERKNFVYCFFYDTDSESKSLKKNKKRNGIPQDVRNKVWQRDSGMCVECGSKEKLEYDHIIPFSKGGSDTYRNLQLLCEVCNRKKHDKI